MEPNVWPWERAAHGQHPELKLGEETPELGAEASTGQLVRVAFQQPRRVFLAECVVKAGAQGPGGVLPETEATKRARG